MLKQTDDQPSARLRTNLSCERLDNGYALFIPPDMARLQPESLRYLQVFARRNDYELIEDRRSVDIRPIIERRSLMPSPMATGISRLLYQTGLRGQNPDLSWPQRLREPERHISLPELVAMTAFSAGQDKRVVLLPNTALANALGDDGRPLAGRACDIVTGSKRHRIHYFEAPALRCVGHSAGQQVVCHLLHAGGPLKSSRLWTHAECMTSGTFRFQLFKSGRPGQDFGLFHSTLYFDIPQTDAASDDIEVAMSA